MRANQTPKSAVKTNSPAAGELLRPNRKAYKIEGTGHMSRGFVWLCCRVCCFYFGRFSPAVDLRFLGYFFPSRILTLKLRTCVITNGRVEEKYRLQRFLGPLRSWVAAVRLPHTRRSTEETLCAWSKRGKTQTNSRTHGFAMCSHMPIKPQNASKNGDPTKLTQEGGRTRTKPRETPSLHDQGETLASAHSTSNHWYSKPGTILSPHAFLNLQQPILG